MVNMTWKRFLFSFASEREKQRNLGQAEYIINYNLLNLKLTTFFYQGADVLAKSLEKMGVSTMEFLNLLPRQLLGFPVAKEPSLLSAFNKGSPRVV